MATGIVQAPQMNWESKDLPGTFAKFKQHCELMFKGPLKQAAESVKASYVLLWIGEKGRDISNTWELTDAEQSDKDMILRKFQEHVNPRTNSVFSRFQFQSRIQRHEETFDDFVTDLQYLVIACRYENPKQMVRDRIVCGIRDTNIREKLLTEGDDLTFDRAIQIAQVATTTQKHLQAFNSVTDSSISTIHKRHTPRRPPAAAAFQPKPCGNCGRVHHRG